MGRHRETLAVAAARSQSAPASSSTLRYYWPGATLRADLFLDDSLYPIPLAASSKVRVCYAPEGQHNLAQRFSAGKRRVDESGGGTTPSHQSIPKS